MPKAAMTTNGVWYVQYRVPGIASPKKEYFGKGELAQVAAEERVKELTSGRVFSVQALSRSKRIYLDELGQCYLDVMKAKDQTDSWIGRVRYLLNEHFLPVLCHVPVNELTFMDVMKVASRFDQKSAATRNRYMDTLKAIFNFGVRLELTTNNPMKIWKKATERPREVELTLEDLTKIYEAAPDHLKWVIEVEWELGTRPGCSELFSLKWSDIDFENDIIRVRGTKTVTSNRLIPLTPNFKERLIEMKKKSGSNYVIEFKGKPIVSCKTAFKAACRRAGIDYGVRLYDIRHLFASTILANGGDLKAVSKLLGHSNTKMTADIYYHELKGEKMSALNKKPSLNYCD